MTRLDELRQNVDVIDRQIVRLLNERARQAIMVGEEKRAGNAPIQDAAREEAVVERAVQANGGVLSAEAVTRIYRAIIEECTAVQEKDS